MNDLSRQAIDAAISGNWEKALELNLHVLKQTGVEATVLNRIARAYCELGDIEKARKYAKKALLVDPFNTIAQKSLEKWQALKNGKVLRSSLLSAHSFLEEPGKTKVVPLVNLADPSVLVSLNCGDPLTIRAQGHIISFDTPEGKHVGKLPDDISHRLKKLVSQGNEYSVIVKSATVDGVKVLIREVKRAAHIKHIASFSAERINYVAFTAPELVHNKKSATSPR